MFAGADKKLPEKDSLELHALWVVFFRVMRKQANVERFYKYRTMEDFLAAYRVAFEEADEREQNKLMQVANWMAVLFTLTDSRGNKGLALNVIPKLVEGFHVKYNTGGFIYFIYFTSLCFSEVQLRGWPEHSDNESRDHL